MAILAEKILVLIESQDDCLGIHSNKILKTNIVGRGRQYFNYILLKISMYFTDKFRVFRP